MEKLAIAGICGSVKPRRVSAQREQQEEVVLDHTGVTCDHEHPVGGSVDRKATLPGHRDTP